MKKLVYLLLFLSLTIIPTFAIEEVTDGDTLTLEMCIELALKNSPVVNKARANVKRASANIGRAKAAWTPAIGAGTFLRGSNDWEVHKSHSTKYFGANASISQMIYDFGKTNASINLSKFNKMAAEYELEYVILETEHEVKSAYLKVLAASATKDVYEEYLEINERLYDQTKAFFDEGIKSRIDFVNAGVNLSNAKYDLIQATDEFCDATIALNKAMFLPESKNYSIVPLEKFNTRGEEKPLIHIHRHDHIDKHDHEHHHIEEISLQGAIKEQDLIGNHILEPFSMDFDDVFDTAKKNRPDLKSYLAIKDSMNESLKLAKRSWYPELGASAGYDFQRVHGVNSNGISYGIDLSIPMVRPLDVKYEIDSAKAEVESANEDVKLMYNDLYYDVQLAMCAVRVHEEQIPLIYERVKLAKEEFELANGRYQEGIGNYIELQDAKSRYLNAQQEYINTVYKYGLARAELDFVMGVR